MNMEEMQKQQDRKNKNFILTKLIPFFVFLILAVSLILAVIYEKTHLNRLSQRLTDAGQKEIIIEQKISALQEEKEQIQRQFVIDSNLKTNIIFCFNDFENSSYHSIIESMKNYGNPGVIVFRTDNMPGMDGSITIEEYKELLADGWEGAVATEGGKILYEYMADPVLDKWKISMDQMRNYFENNGLEFPHIYIAAEGELLNSVEIYFPQYGITGYAVVEYNGKKAARELMDDAMLDMGMIKAKYIYKDLESDLKELQYEGKSMAMRFQTVESSSPSNIYNTSIYRLNTYLETISNSENAQITTFQGYRDYQEAFENDNAELIQQYKAKLEKIENEMKKLEQENDRNYKNAISYY